MEAMAQGTEELPEVAGSGALVQGLGAGFAFVFRGNRVLGAKKFTQDTWVARVGEMADPTERARALRTVESLEKGKRFEFTKDEVQAIEFTPPGRLGAGRIVFRTAQGEEAVKVAGTFGTGTAGLFDMLFRRFREFAPGKVRRVD